MAWDKTWRPPEEAMGYPNYSPLPAAPTPILVIFPRQRKQRCCCCQPVLGFLIFLLMVGFTGFLLWPRNPNVEVTRTDLQGISLNTLQSNGSLFPTVFLNVDMTLDLQIMNPNLFGINYDLLTVHIMYRGHEIAVVNSTGGRIPARSIAHSTATMNLQGLQVLHDIPFLLIDMADNRLPLDTLTIFAGTVEIFFFKPYAELIAIYL
ncbi:hypothetical protein O6H91_02G064200 [Diphasiastrum complanatum]|uniref:Uncharacterized protein n=2 Tax=Diphasiastrum complanatum TaxID=34168 RepID=A0ACC2EGE2_DIPCM|nr:hypothetical protein O6H91_02G064200 [Diphasiastrum complanatum]KAJ7565532.1 hypothetical protein O6H91_02G064200 [Diphasiastrum complanatum]